MFEQYIKLNTAVGVSIQIHNDNSLDINSCQIQRKRHSLDFIKKVSGLESLDDLTVFFPEKAAIALNMNGKGVLHKQVDKIGEINHVNFSQILPNANFNDFYVQNFISGYRSFISIIRRAEANKWLDKCRELGFNVLMLSLGPYPVQMILTQLNVYGEEVIFDGNVILRNKELEWESCYFDESQRAPFPFKVQNESLDENLVLAYATGFQLLFVHFAETIEAEVPALRTAINNVISNKRIRILGSLSLGVFFAALAINFILLSVLTTENKKLAGQINHSADGSQHYADLIAEIKAKEQKLESLGWDGNIINKASIVDQLAQHLPDEVTWTEISVNPINVPESRNLQEMVFEDQMVRITGFAKRIVPVNNWISEVKKNSWIKSVQLQSYMYNSEEETGQFVVEVKY